MSTQSLSPESFQTLAICSNICAAANASPSSSFPSRVGYSEAQISRLEQNQRLPDLTALKALFIPALHLENEPELAARFLELAQSARQEDAPAPGIASL